MYNLSFENIVPPELFDYVPDDQCHIIEFDHNELDPETNIFCLKRYKRKFYREKYDGVLVKFARQRYDSLLVMVKFAGKR